MSTSYTLLGASAIGIGSLCLYGLNTRSIGNWAGPLWRDYVRDRVRKTHIYLTLGLGVTAGSAILAWRSPTVASLADYGIIPVSLGSLALIFGSGGLTRSIPYENFALKFGSWFIHYAAMGTLLPVFCIFGGPNFLRFLIYLSGVMAGASAVGMCAPSKKFMLTAKPAGIILGVVAAVNIADMYFSRKVQFMPQGSTDYAIYAGLLLFSLYCAFNGQRVIQAAEMIPQHGGAANQGASFLDRYGQQAMVGRQSGNFDPINAQMSVFMDMANFLFRSYVV